MNIRSWKGRSPLSRIGLVRVFRNRRDAAYKRNIILVLVDTDNIYMYIYTYLWMYILVHCNKGYDMLAMAEKLVV